MHRLWNNVVRPILTAADSRVIVEIGTETGANTNNLAKFAKEKGGIVHTIDPNPTVTPEQQAIWGNSVVLHKMMSVDALPHIEHPDTVLIDGDHNFHTVLQELTLIAGQSSAQNFPVIVLHDVGWPYARRDMYYAPERIPTSEQQPWAMKGIIPGHKDLADAGGLNPNLRNALQEGGEKNGVLTAIEQFLRSTSLDLQLYKIPGFNGIGVIASTTMLSRKPMLNTLLTSWRSTVWIAPHLDALEEKRVQLEHTLNELSVTHVWTLHKYEILEQTVASIKTERESLRQELMRLELTQSELRQQLALAAESTAQKKILEADLLRLQGETAALNVERSHLEIQLASLNERAVAAEQEQSRLQETVQHMKAEQQKLEAMHATLGTEIVALKAQIAAGKIVEEERNNLRQRLALHEIDRQMLIKKAKDAIERREQIEVTMGKMKAHVETVNTERVRMRDEVTKLEQVAKEVVTLTTERLELQEQLNEMTLQRDTMQQEVTALRDLRERARVMTEEKQDLQSRLAHIQSHRSWRWTAPLRWLDRTWKHGTVKIGSMLINDIQRMRTVLGHPSMAAGLDAHHHTDVAAVISCHTCGHFLEEDAALVHHHSTLSEVTPQERR